MAQPQMQRGMVKSVLSGDSVILQGKPVNGPPPEHVLGLSQLSAPRLCRRPGNDGKETKDEPFAWEAREFLRKKLVGKVVTYFVEYKTNSGRDYGKIFVPDGRGGHENISHSLVSEGLAKIRDGAKGDGEDFEAMKALQGQAEAAHKGIWSEESELAKHVRNVTWNIENPRSLVDGLRQKPVRAVIEQVRDGCTVRAFLLPDFKYVTVNFSGIKTPMFKRQDDGTMKPEPYAEEAKYFTESRLLQREVLIVLESVNNNNFLGSVMHPQAGNISPYILAEGLAKIVDWSIGVVSEGREKYRAAQTSAQQRRLRLWKDWKPTHVPVVAGQRDFSGIVEEIVNPDCLIVNVGGESRKLFLSSIRPPRPPQTEGETAKPSGGRRLYTVPYFFEAREFLRRRVIGKQVNVHIDFIQAANEKFPEKTCCTIKFENINLAEALVSKGLAEVLRHRQGDENRASAYDDLLAAEARSVKNGKGVHSKKEPPTHRVAEVTNKSQADTFVRSLQRAGRAHGVVEYIAAGSRFRVYIPKETCVISLMLAGLQCPRASGRADQPAEPFGNEALALARSLCMQRDVELEVVDADRNGNFLGQLFVDGQDISVALLEKGYAKLHPSAQKLSNFARLSAIESAAQEAKLGLWKNYVPEVQQEEVEEQPAERKTNYIPVVATEVKNGNTVFLQAANDANTAEIMHTMSNSSFTGGSFTPKKGALCSACYTLDGLWYRAKITNVEGSNIDVTFIDFGNSETTTADRLAPLPTGMAAKPPLARECRLAFLAPVPEDWVAETEGIHRDAFVDKKFMCNIEYKRDGVDCVTLLDEQNIDVGLDLVQAGYGVVVDRAAGFLQDVFRKYKSAQARAIEDRVGVWVYGDIREDDL